YRWRSSTRQSTSGWPDVGKLGKKLYWQRSLNQVLIGIRSITLHISGTSHSLQFVYGSLGNDIHAPAQSIWGFSCSGRGDHHGTCVERACSAETRQALAAQPLSRSCGTDVR